MLALNKISYSKYEKVLRIICFIGIVISEFIGILLLCIEKYSSGIIVLSACLLSSFLISSFSVKRIKDLFSSKKFKRVLYVIYYFVVILIAMLTALILVFNATYSLDDLVNISIDFVENRILASYPSATIIDSEIFDAFESSGSYYFAIETTYTLSEGQNTTTHYPNTYININQVTGNITLIDWIAFENSRNR